MITLKLKYKVSTEDAEVIAKYVKQYTSAFHVAYNYIFEHQEITKTKLLLKDSELNQKLNSLNNIELIIGESGYFFRQQAISEA